VVSVYKLIYSQIISDTYEAMAEAIQAARHQIFITDWFLSPEVYLVRKPHMIGRLDTLLADKGNKKKSLHLPVKLEIMVLFLRYFFRP